MSLPGRSSTKRSYGARAVVTGAGSGIGQAIAREVVERGGKVICADIDVVAAEATAEAINQGHPGSAFDARVLWRIKRLAPATYARALGAMNKRTPVRTQSETVKETS